MTNEKRLKNIESALSRIQSQMVFSGYRGTSSSDFTTTTLTNHGDYGYQTTDNEIQMNCNGTIRAVSTAAL